MKKIPNIPTSEGAEVEKNTALCYERGQTFTPSDWLGSTPYGRTRPLSFKKKKTKKRAREKNQKKMSLAVKGNMTSRATALSESGSLITKKRPWKRSSVWYQEP